MPCWGKIDFATIHSKQLWPKFTTKDLYFELFVAIDSFHTQIYLTS
jgi:hypothetical protein